MVEWQKLSASLGSGTPDPSRDSAAVEPIPPPRIENKPAPGRKGPKGTAPRTTYSRVNTGEPPTPDAGSSSQKGQQPRGMEFLPAKVAHQEKTSMTTMMRRPILHDLVKEAMEGTVAKVDISLEAQRQLANAGEAPEQTKQASAEPQEETQSVPTEYCEKLASALDYILEKQAGEGTTSLKPGVGPNATEVLEATSADPPIEPSSQGSATDKNSPPKTPPMESSGVAKDPSNAMATNMDMSHPEQPTDPWQNEKSKAAAALAARNMARIMGEGQPAEQPKEAAAEPTPADIFAKNLARFGIEKSAEDAINPAQISAGKTQTGATPPEGASPSEEGVPSEPSDVTSQKRLIANNEAPVDATRKETKADPKSDLGKVLTEPALSASTDKTLQKTLDHTSEAGAKISHDLTRTAAAQALLSKLAEEVRQEQAEGKVGELSKEALFKKAPKGVVEKGKAFLEGAKKGWKARGKGESAVSKMLKRTSKGSKGKGFRAGAEARKWAPTAAAAAAAGTAGVAAGRSSKKDEKNGKKKTSQMGSPPSPPQLSSISGQAGASAV